MKRILLFTSIVLWLSACGNEEPESHPEEPTEEQTTETVEDGAQEEETDITDETTEEDEMADAGQSDKGNRTNPYQIGEMAEITVTDYDDEYNELEGTATVTIDNVLRGEEAFEQLNEEVAPAMHDQPEEDGMEWFLFDLNVELLKFVDADTSYTVATGITIFNENGEQVPSTTAARQHSAGNTLFQGGRMESKEAYTAPSEGSFLIKINDAEEDVFFEVPNGETSETVESDDSTEAEESSQEEIVQENTTEEPQAESFNITDQSTLESIVYGDYTEEEKIQAYNSAVANGVIPQGTVSEGSAVSAYESSVGLQDGESEYDQMKATYQSWVDEGLMTEEEMELELNKIE